MALLFMDGFDHYSTLTDKGWAISNIGGTTTGRNGNGGYTGANWSSGVNGTVSRFIPSNATVIIGMALNFGDLAQTPYFQLRESSGGVVHIEMTRNGSGLLEFRRGAGGTLLGTTSTVIAANTWFHIQIKLTVNDTTGALVVKINDNQEVNFSGDTRNGGASGIIDQILFGSNQISFNTGQRNWFFDDIFILDTTGSTNNDFIGDCKVETKFPNGDGNYSQLDGSDGNTTNNYLLVDETSPNGDTDYVESGDIGDEDTYAVQNITTVPATIKGVQINLYAKKTDAGTRKVKSVARLSGTDADSSVEHTLTTSYAYYQDIRETKPGGGAWSTSDVDSSEFGMKVTA